MPGEYLVSSHRDMIFSRVQSVLCVAYPIPGAVNSTNWRRGFNKEIALRRSLGATT
jgi:hypothetical protein